MTRVMDAHTAVASVTQASRTTNHLISSRSVGNSPQYSDKSSQRVVAEPLLGEDRASVGAEGRRARPTCPV